MNKKILMVVAGILIIMVIGLTAVLSNNRKKTETSNNTNSYSPEGVNIADENEIGISADEAEFNRNPANVTIEILADTISNTSAEILITDNNVNRYGWGVEFRVQEKIDNEWKNYISDDLTWIDIAYELNADNQLTQKLNIEKYYGKLNNGIYRIVKPVYDDGYVDIYSNEFEIK